MLELKEIATVKLSDVHGGNAATEVPLHGAINVLDALPESRKYWTWPGSLTTPPCAEGVTWVLLQQTVTIGPNQVKAFPYPNNFRTVQPLNARTVYSGSLQKR